MKLILRNIRKNKLDYSIYLATVTIGFTIMYIFNAIIFNEKLEGILEEFNKVNGIFYGALVVVIISIAMFIWYSNLFFIKKRKKEIGIFSLFGIDDKKISRMIFNENMIIGIVAAILGLILGMIFSLYITKLYIHMFNSNIVIQNEILNIKALLITTIIFFAFYTYICMNSSSVIRKYELIDLFKGDNKSEEPFKRPFIKGVPAIIIIVIGYITYPWSILTLGLSVIVTLIITVKGTYKLFSTNIVDRILEKKEKSGFNDGINLVSTSNLLFRIRSNSRTLATVSILIAATITALGICSTLYFSTDTGLKNGISESIFFVGVFIGIIFTISTASILLFKFMQEAYDEKKRYKTLREIGFSDKDIKEIVTKQLKTIYFLPFLIGGIHGLVALSITFISLAEKFFIVIGGVYLIYGGVYFVYFLITRRLYLAIIDNRF